MKLILTTILLFGYTFSNAQYDPKAKSILDAMSEKYKSIASFKANFSYNMRSPAEKIDEKFTGDITVKGDKYHVNLDEQEIYNDGETVWTYLKEENEVTVTDYEPDPDDPSPTAIFDMYKDGFKYIFIKEKNIKKEKCLLVDLDPEDKNRSFFKIRLTIRKSDKTIKSWEIFEKNGRVFEYAINNFNEKARVTENDFRFNEKKYKDVELIDLKN